MLTMRLSADQSELKEATDKHTNNLSQSRDLLKFIYIYYIYIYIYNIYKYIFPKLKCLPLASSVYDRGGGVKYPIH